MKKVIATIRETSQRTIEYQCEIEVPIGIEDEDEYITEHLEDASWRRHFVDIVNSELLDSDIISVEEGELPQNIVEQYTIVL